MLVVPIMGLSVLVGPIVEYIKSLLRITYTTYTNLHFINVFNGVQGFPPALNLHQNLHSLMFPRESKGFQESDRLHRGLGWSYKGRVTEQGC